ncbi:thioesterase family protein [Massilia sp. PWRC2]|uniref:thioesterase family protein n=1 Tax=Massilia sp. PWRC2 TaxID=2804626 RepID=UPI003CF01F19
MSSSLQAGLRFSWRYTVPERASVPALYHDTDFCRDMPAVLATGYLVGMMELACVHGIMPFVDWPRQQSLGTMVNFRHLAPTPPGMELRIEGEVLAVDGRRLTFRVEAWDNLERVCEGTHERMLIEPQRFAARLASKVAAAQLSSPLSSALPPPVPA